MGSFRAPIKVLRRGPLIPGPYRIALRHTPTFFGKLAMERWIGIGRSVPPHLKSLAQLRAGALVGCVW